MVRSFCYLYVLTMWLLRNKNERRKKAHKDFSCRLLVGHANLLRFFHSSCISRNWVAKMSPIPWLLNKQKHWFSIKPCVGRREFKCKGNLFFMLICQECFKIMNVVITRWRLRPNGSYFPLGAAMRNAGCTRRGMREWLMCWHQAAVWKRAYHCGFLLHNHDF